MPIDRQKYNKALLYAAHQRTEECNSRIAAIILLNDDKIIDGIVNNETMSENELREAVEHVYEGLAKRKQGLQDRADDLLKDI